MAKTVFTVDLKQYILSLDEMYLSGWRSRLEGVADKTGPTRASSQQSHIKSCRCSQLDRVGLFSSIYILICLLSLLTNRMIAYVQSCNVHICASNYTQNSDKTLLFYVHDFDSWNQGNLETIQNQYLQIEFDKKIRFDCPDSAHFYIASTSSPGKGGRSPPLTLKFREYFRAF